MRIPLQVVGSHVRRGEFESFRHLMNLLSELPTVDAHSRLFEAGYRVQRLPVYPPIVEGEIVGEG